VAGEKENSAGVESFLYMAISLTPGTVVMLKSGGPSMTVVGERTAAGVNTGQVTCEWFEKSKPMRGDFAETSLKVIEDDGGSFNVMGR
jgi:uncharacterized protein YodC (DUF2158 family)